MNSRKLLGVTFLLAGLGLTALAGVIVWANQSPGAAVASGGRLASPSPWPLEPIVPTAEPDSALKGGVRLLEPDTPTSLGTAGPMAAAYDPGAAGTYRARQRFGVGVPHPLEDLDILEGLGLGWYLTWRVTATPLTPGDVEFFQMIRLHEQGYLPDSETIQMVARANPGTTWLIGNEPDVLWQDNVTPARYAEWYHELYTLVNDVDPTAKIAIGGVTQPTPLRLTYLEMVLEAYETSYGSPMPIDVWNIHAFILREERGSWGVEIPPGIGGNQGTLYEVEDHDDVEIFKTHIINFRRWLADHGQRNKPLIISEYGILMPKDYGFGPARVEDFLVATYDFMLNAADEELGYPADGNRLVQRWAWYSLNDDRYPTGNLIDFATGNLTRIGQAHRRYLAELP
jgi:hypothetical protein